MMILQTTTDSDSEKDIQRRLKLTFCRLCHSERLLPVILSEAKNLKQNVFSVILSEAKNLKREPGGSRIVVVLQILR